MQVSKLNLSEEESAALKDDRFFIIKSSVTQKVTAVFGELEATLKESFPGYGISCEGLNYSSGKIFRGENYKLFPYILLDYPRLFSTNSIFAFRTMLWWGHEFSFTLHLQGEAFRLYGERILSPLQSLHDTGTFFCVNDTPWQYTFTPDNYIPVEELKSGMTDNREFIKISRRIPVEQFHDVAIYCQETFSLFMNLLRSR